MPGPAGGDVLEADEIDLVADDGAPRTGGRIPFLLLAAVLAVVVGAAGLVRGLVEPAAAEPTVAIPASAVRAGPIAVYGAWIREPATAATAAAYLTITNTGAGSDTLIGVTTGASQSASMHDIGKPVAVKPKTAEEAMGAETMVEDASVPIRPGQTITLKPTAGHIMLEQLIGTLAPGQSVNILLQFERAGTIVVDAPVVAIGDPPPAD